MPREVRNVYTNSTHTRVRVAFYTDERNGLNLSEPVEAHPGFGAVIAFQSSKQIGPAAGTWSLTIKKPPSFGPVSALRRLWRDPEDVWCSIKVVVDGQVIDTVLGLVDAVNEDTQRSGSGQRSETYTISGRDFGKVFEQTELWVNFFHQPDNPLRSAGALTATFLERLIGTPAHFVRILVEEWVGNSGAAEAQWLLPAGLGGGFFFNRLSTGGIQAMNRLEHGEAIAPTLFQIDQTGGKLWDVMQEYANGLMNELFVDLAPRPGRSPRDLADLEPKLYLRERPFPTRSDDGRSTSKAKWNQLRTHVLEPGDVQRRNIAKGGAATRFNYWLLQLEGIGTEGFNVAEILQRGVDGVPYGHPGNIPIFNTESIQRHGVRRYLATTRFIPFITANTEAAQRDRDNFFRLAARWLKKLHDWYAPAPFELTGRIETTRILPEIRVGERVKERRAEGTIVYYVEGVDHRYTYPNSGQTTLTLTRGEYEGEDLLEYVYESYQNPRALSAREACFISEDAPIEEVIDALAAGCRFEAPPVGNVEGFTTREDQLEAIEGEDFTVANEPRTLEVERDGGDTPADQPADGALSDAEPSVGEVDDIPPAGETGEAPASPVLDQGALERGEPIDAPEEWIDPIEGLENAGF